MKTEKIKTLSGQFYKTLLDSLFDAVYTVDNEGLITYWNESCSRITGYSADEMIGQSYDNSPFAYVEPESGQTQNQSSGIKIVLETAMPGTWKGHLRRKNGQRIPIESHISPIQGNDGKITGAVEVFRDNSARVALEDAHRQVLQLSRKDRLTGLFNRTAISDLLKAEIERSRRYDQMLSVVMMDIDLFKRINDRYGHDAGDIVLAKMAAVLRHNLRQPDAIGRWGGEEFLIVAPGSDAAAGAALAERIRQYIKQIPSRELPEPVTASFGVSELQKQQGLDQLLYVADMALYKAKRTGRDRVIIGSQDSENHKS
jgi:diguanylate cyclase (GGDEF)-like protein/PAS domain S-box-containing protein